MKYLAIIFDGFEEEEAMAPFALINRAGGEVVIASNKNEVTGSNGFTLSKIKNLNDIDYKKFDVLIIPGGGGQYKNLMTISYVHEIIKYFYNQNKVIASICAAPTVLGSLGLLKDRNYTCFTSMNADFGGTYHDDGVVVDGNLITARSVAYSIKFAYTIIEKTLGVDTLKAVWTRIYYEE